jgi:hypothetical protein
MNDNDGGLAAMIIGQWVTVLLLALIFGGFGSVLANPYSSLPNNLFASS